MMRILHKTLGVMALCLLLGNPSFAQEQKGWQDKQGNIHKQTSWQKFKDNLGVMLFAVKDFQAFEEAWYRPASADYTPNIPVIEKAKVNEVIRFVVMFAGCQANTKGNCLLKGSFKITSPKGKVLVEKELDFYNDKQPQKGITTSSPVVVGYQIEEQDDLGDYRFDYVVTDVNANTTLNVFKTITFTK